MYREVSISRMDESAQGRASSEEPSSQDGEGGAVAEKGHEVQRLG